MLQSVAQGGHHHAPLSLQASPPSEQPQTSRPPARTRAPVAPSEHRRREKQSQRSGHWEHKHGNLRGGEG